MRKALLSLAALTFAIILPAPASAQCTNPDGVAGVMVWNADYCVTQICDGTQWIATHPRPINCLGGPGDNIPHVFDFTDVADATLSTQYTDNVTVEGFVVAPLTASVTGGGAEIQNVTAGSPWAATADMNPGEELAIRMTSSGSQGTAVTATVTLGAATVDWVVTTSSAADTTPDPFDFTDVASADLSTQYDDTVTVTGFDGPLTASVSGGGAEIRNNTLASSWGSTADMNPGNVLEIRMTSDASFATAKTADVTLGTATVDWIVTTSGDNTDPVWSTAAGTVATINTGDALSTTVTATDDSGSVSYTKQSGAGWISVNSSTGALTGTAPGSAGTSSITVRAEDPAGNFTDRTFDVVVQDGTDPVWSTAAGTVATINTGDSLSTTVMATDDSGSVSYAKQSGAAWISVNSSTGELTGTAPGTANTYSITVRAEDPSGNFVDRTFDVVVQDNTDPVWSTAAGTVATINTGDALSTTVTATDDSGSVSYTKQSGDAWISVNSSTGELTGTAPGSANTYSITVRAEDPAGNFTDRTFDVVVQDTTDPVWSTAAGTVATINTGDTLSTSVTATDDSGSVSYAKQSGDAWISVNSSTGALTGTAPGSSGTSSITVRAQDPSGNFTDRNFDVVVQSSNACPSTPSDPGDIGCVMPGGEIFAGDTDLYVTDTNQSTSIPWSTEYVNTGATSATDGAANQQWIVNNKTLSQYHAFQLCENLDRHGHTDWYLPARNELHDVLYPNRTAIGGFGGAEHWSSTASISDWLSAYYVNFSDGFESTLWKGSGGIGVRCVRRDVAVNDTTDPVWSTAAGTVATINTGDALSASVTATDDSGSVSYAKQSGAGWISVNSSTGELTGTAPGSANTYSITVRAEDPAGNFTDRTFDVVVEPASPTGCPNIGDVCSDGSVFAGEHSLSLANIYVTDVTQSTSSNWNDAMTLCDNLSRHGHADWYLPDIFALNLNLHANRVIIGGFTAGSYWSSSEFPGGVSAWCQVFSDSMCDGYKTTEFGVRCVRDG